MTVVKYGYAYKKGACNIDKEGRAWFCLGLVKNKLFLGFLGTVHSALC